MGEHSNDSTMKILGGVSSGLEQFNWYWPQDEMNHSCRRIDYNDEEFLRKDFDYNIKAIQSLFSNIIMTTRWRKCQHYRDEVTIIIFKASTMMIDERDVLLINYEYRYAYPRERYPMNEESYCTTAISEMTGIVIAKFVIMVW